MHKIFMRLAHHLTVKKICLIGFAAACALWFTACGKDNEGTVRLIDDSLQVTVLGTNKDGFDAPDGILWKKGRLFMADEGGPALRIWAGAHHVETLSDAGDRISAPEDLVVDDDGLIYFTDDDVGGVWQVSTEGKTSQLAGKDKGLVSTEGIAISPSGQILVGDGKQQKIYSVNKQGEVEIFLDSGIRKPESLVFDEQGNLYIADNVDNIVYLLTTEKQLIALIADRRGFSPESIWYADGTLYITDSDHGKLFSFTLETGLETLAEFSGVLRKVNGITTDDNGSIYLSIQTHIDNKHSYLLKLDRKNKMF
jgi:sugar lactone lactonase YvrE